MEAQKGRKAAARARHFCSAGGRREDHAFRALLTRPARCALGRVDRGDAHLDTHELERARGITIFSKQARFETERLAVTHCSTRRAMPILRRRLSASCPSSTARCCSSAARTACQGRTLTLWRLLRHYGVPVVLFFNKMDLPGGPPPC